MCGAVSEVSDAYVDIVQSSMVTALPPFQPSGRKKALLIGIEYEGQKKRNQLEGCVNDVMCMRYFLAKWHGFRPEDFVIMTDKVTSLPVGVHNGGVPTRANMIRQMKSLVRNARPGDSLFFHFCGHGTQVRDKSGDESDGLDEAILPVDFKKAGKIIDDDIYDVMVRGTPWGARLTALLDCCHSGTGFDLPYICDPAVSQTHTVLDVPEKRPSLISALADIVRTRNQEGPAAASQEAIRLAHLVMRRKTLRPHVPNPHAGQVLLFSGCRDYERSAATRQLSSGTFTGAMTHRFIQCIEEAMNGDPKNCTYYTLLSSMREKLAAADLAQIPQLTSSHRFDLMELFKV